VFSRRCAVVDKSVMNAELKEKLAQVRLLLCDVDGVLTDGTVLMGDGVEMKRFSIVDGLGMRLLQRYGVRVGWVSRRPSPATTMRAQDLKIDYLRQVDGDKVRVVEELLSKSGLGWKELCFVGDDVVDLGVLKRVGVAVAVSNGIAEVKAVADYVTDLSGGNGAVREVVDLILKAQEKWTTMLKDYGE
jgi:3-deoxy-D-manno-octulosonate 8-phosphate phosphatase (KDO 8-P phosphatase)